MLKYPYKLIDKKGINKYYLTNINDQNYLAIESIVKLPKDLRTKKSSSEFTQGLKVIHLSAPLLLLLLRFSETKPIGEEKNVFDETEPIYSILDVQEVKQKAYDLFKNSGVERYAFPDTVENEVVEALKREGYELFMTEKESNHLHINWLIYPSKQGNLRLYEVITAGMDGFDYTISLHTYNLDIGIVKKLLQEIKKQEKN